MAFSKFLRRICSSGISSPSSIRAISTQRNYYSSLLTPLNSNTTGTSQVRRNFLPVTYFSSSFSTESGSDDNLLLKLIDYEIKWAQDSTKVKKVPDWFGFELEDNPGGETVSLRREYQGEIIDVEVQIPAFANRNNENVDDNDDDEKDGENGDVDEDDSIPLVVSVSKGSGTCLEFGVTAFPHQQKISIDLLSIKRPHTCEDGNAYEGPEFSNLDHSLQEALYKYLDIRGINPTTMKYLHSYMINKESREYLMWLKNVKKFLII